MEKKKIYCDTCIYIDYFFDQTNERGRYVGEEAAVVFTKVLKGLYILIVSDFIIEEFKANETKDEYIQLEKKLGNNIKYIKYTQEDKDKAKKLNLKNWQDTLHIILAEKAGCRYIITQNLKDFYPIQRQIDVILPISLS